MLFCRRRVDAQPRSTLLLLVSAFAGGLEPLLGAYQHALGYRDEHSGGARADVSLDYPEPQYRFLSFGDACIFFGGVPAAKSDDRSGGGADGLD